MQAIQKRNLKAMLALYDNKGLSALAASVLGLKSAAELMERVQRLLGDDKKGIDLRKALAGYLPAIPVPTGVAPIHDAGVQANTSVPATAPIA